MTTDGTITCPKCGPMEIASILVRDNQTTAVLEVHINDNDSKLTEEEIMRRKIDIVMADAICLGIDAGREKRYMSNEEISVRATNFTDKIVKIVKTFMIP